MLYGKPNSNRWKQLSYSCHASLKTANGRSVLKRPLTSLSRFNIAKLATIFREHQSSEEFSIDHPSLTIILCNLELYNLIRSISCAIWTTMEKHSIMLRFAHWLWNTHRKRLTYASGWVTLIISFMAVNHTHLQWRGSFIVEYSQSESESELK